MYMDRLVTILKRKKHFWFKICFNYYQVSPSPPCRPTVLESILNDLFHVFRYETCSNLRQVNRVALYSPCFLKSFFYPISVTHTLNEVPISSHQLHAKQIRTGSRHSAPSNGEAQSWEAYSGIKGHNSYLLCLCIYISVFVFVHLYLGNITRIIFIHTISFLVMIIPPHQNVSFTDFWFCKPLLCC